MIAHNVFFFCKEHNDKFIMNKGSLALWCVLWLAKK